MKKPADKSQQQIANSQQPKAQSQQQIEVMLELLRAGVFGRVPVLDSNIDVDWDELFDKSLSHEVMAWVWDGICNLPPSLMPPRNVRIGWSLSAQEVWDEYERQNTVLQTLLNLANRNNIRLLLLKGHSLSSLYPRPCSRACGDIDVLPLDHHELLNELLSQYIIDNRGKHVTFKIDGVVVEVHHNFLEPNTRQKRKIIDYLFSSLDQVVLIPEGYNVLPVMANLIFLLFHTTKHFQESRFLPVRNILDFYMTLSHSGSDIDKAEFKLLLEQFHLQKSFSMLLYMAEKIMGVVLIDYHFFQIPMRDINCFDVFLYGSLSRDNSSTDMLPEGITFSEASNVVARYLPDNYSRKSLIKRRINLFLKVLKWRLKF